MIVCLRHRTGGGANDVSIIRTCKTDEVMVMVNFLHRMKQKCVI